MKKIGHLILLALTLFSGGQLCMAQCKDNSFQILDGNQVEARFNNGANFFWDMQANTALEVPKGSGLSTVFAGALWVGGLDPQGGLHVAASTYRQNGWEWYAGPYRDGAAYQCDASVDAGSPLFYKGIKRLHNGKILILAENAVVIYDEFTRQSISRPLPAPRTWLAAQELPDGRIFLLGDDLYPAKNPVLFMDTVNYNITGGPTLNWFHKESSVDLLDDGRVLLAGVVGCEIFDPATNLSMAVPDMLYPRQRHGTAKLPNGDILACGGGSTLNGNGLTIFTQIFDDTLGYWFPGPVLAVGRQRATVTAMPDGKLFISGGSTMSKVSEIYEPDRDTIYSVAFLPEFATAHSVTPLDTQWVLIAAEGDNLMSKLFKFNIYTGAVENLHIQRGGAKSILLSTPEVLVDIEDGHRLQRIDINTGLQDDDRWQYVWKLSRAEIDVFKADFLSGNVDFVQYPLIESWPAHGSEALGEDRNLAPFVDVNGDGLYRPAADGDYPCIVGDQALWWVFNDQGPHNDSHSPAMGLQVEAMAYEIDCRQSPCPDTSLDYTIFLHLELTNRSDTAYHSMYVGQYQDIDIGDYADDYVGTDSSLQLAFGYNGDDLDIKYGQHPPAWGTAVMPNGQLDRMASARHYQNMFGTVMGNPASGPDYYNYLQGRFLDSLPMVNNGLDGYPGTAAGPLTHYMYSSTDGFCGGPLAGWSEFTAGNLPFDRTLLQSSGPFALQPGEKIQWDLAFIYARDSSNLLSVCRLKSATASIQGWWQNQLDKSCWSTLVSNAEPMAASSFTVFPNPSGGGNVQAAFGAALEDAGELQIFDLQGRMVMQVALQAGALGTRLDVGTLGAGMYLLRLQAGARVETQRLVLEY
jgi:Secretion system C-terminal sorting domain